MRYGTRASRKASLSAADLGPAALRLATVLLPRCRLLAVRRGGLLQPLTHGFPEFRRSDNENFWAVAAEFVGQDVRVGVVEGECGAVCLRAASLQEACGGIRPRNHLDGRRPRVPHLFEFAQADLGLISWWRGERFPGLRHRGGDATKQERA